MFANGTFNKTATFGALSLLYTKKIKHALLAQNTANCEHVQRTF